MAYQPEQDWVHPFARLSGTGGPKKPKTAPTEGGVNRNVNGQQFGKSPFRQGLEKVVEGHSRAQYFRHAGMGAAIRFTLGMEQTPSHMNDYINSRGRVRRSTGMNPGDVNAMLDDEA